MLIKLMTFFRQFFTLLKPHKKTKLKSRSQPLARIICYIIRNCITYNNAISNYISNNTIAQVSPRGGAANEDPPYPRPIHSPFTQKNLKFIYHQINTSFDVRLHNV